MRPFPPSNTSEPRECCKVHKALTQAKGGPMAQAHSPLPASHPSVEQVAGAINEMIAERAVERLKAPQVASEPSLKPREPGVYFGLPSADYYADPSLGSSDLKRLRQAPAVYWWHSHMNPERQPSLDSPAKQKGRALHNLVL